MTPTPDGMNIGEAAAFCGLSRNTFKKFLRLGVVPHRRLDAKTVLFSRRALTAWMAGQDVGALAPTGTDGAQPGGQTGAPTRTDKRRPFQPAPDKLISLRRAR